MTPTPAQSRSRIIATRCFLAAAAGACASGATTWMQPVLFQYLIQNRSMHEASAGLLITVELGAMSLASMAMARLVKRQHAQLFAIGGMILAIIASLFSLYAPSQMTLFIARFVVGIGLGATIMVANIIAANFPDPDKTFAHLGLINLGFGAISMGAYGQLLLFHSDTTPYLFLLLVLAVLLPVMAGLPKFNRFDHRGSEMEHGHKTGSTQSMRTRTLLLSLITFAIVVTSGILWALYSVIGQQAGLSMAEVNNAIAISIAAGFAGTALPAIVGGKLGRIAPFCIGLAVLAGAILVLTSTPNATWFVIAVCGNVAAIYFLMPYLSGAAAMIDGGGNAAAYVGSTFFFGSAVSPLLAGILISTVGISMIGACAVAVAFAAALTFIHVERIARRTNQADDGEPHLAAVHLPVIDAEGNATAYVK